MLGMQLTYLVLIYTALRWRKSSISKYRCITLPVLYLRGRGWGANSQKDRGTGALIFKGIIKNKTPLIYY